MGAFRVGVIPLAWASTWFVRDCREGGSRREVGDYFTL